VEEDFERVVPAAIPGKGGSPATWAFVVRVANSNRHAARPARGRFIKQCFDLEFGSAERRYDKNSKLRDPR
jgi:hypothetical protein